MNAYYTNRLEGEHTRPSDIELALQQDFSSNADLARRQRLAVAHIHTEEACEAELARRLAADGLAADGETAARWLYSPDALMWLHQALFSALPAADLLLADGALAPVLAAMGWTLDLDSVVPFARWHPKNERIPRIFDTRFYLADLGTGAVELEIDETETTHLFWTTASDALAAAERGELGLIFPTRRNLERLAEFASFAEARAQAEAIPVKTITPWMEDRDGERWLMIRDDAGYPVPGEPLSTAARA